MKKRKINTPKYFRIFVYWPPFHIFHINLDMMECFVRSPSHYWTASDPPPCSIQAPSLPNAVRSLFCSRTTRKYKLVIQSNMHADSLSRTHFLFNDILTFSHAHAHTTATRVWNRAEMDAGGTEWETGEAVQCFPPCFRQN